MQSAVRLAPIYRTQAVDAVLDLGDGREYRIRALDKTAGITIGRGVSVEALGPGAMIRATDLGALGLTKDQLDAVGATLALNGATFGIASVRPVPGQGGEADGEYMLLLGGT